MTVDAHVNKRRTQAGEVRYDVRYRGPDDKERFSELPYPARR